MKFSVASTELQKALTKISGVVPSKSTLPILENILFELNKNTLRLVATDLEVSMSVSLDVKGSEDGRIAVPAKRVMETIRALPEVQVHFAADTTSNRIKMLTDSGEYALVGESSEEFPTVPQFKGGEKIVLSGDALRRMISRTVFAVSADELRPAMTGLLLQLKQKEIRAVATDGHRLVRIKYSALAQPRTEKDLIIPAKALTLLARSIEEGETGMTVDGSHVQFAFSTVTLISRLIEEAYPNYESVIPLDNDNVLTVSRDLLLAAVRRVSLYSSSTTHQIRFSLKKSELRLAAEDIDFGGEAKEKVPCEYQGEEMEIGFNSTYIIDILSHIDAEEIIFRFSSPVRAAIIAPVQQREHEDLLMLVMPMRLNA